MNAAQLMGMRVVVVRPTPRMQLPDDLPLKPEFRASYNAWLAKSFGIANDYKDGQVLVAGDIAYMNAATHSQVKAEWVRYCSGFSFGQLSQGGWP